ncbi:MAG TPA: YhdH/YhfP family quinone oxidoreductase [Candidatus Binatia bacterium]|jgi:putative YhdH/YhfP family quinone oxidoreductase|nr:YhdH/YhfP family quinone oxidoreductase [Candidatus Binatia bacterium]
MDDQTFQALVVSQDDEGRFNRTVAERQTSDLPEGDLLIRVHYSSLNYKDALSASGHRGVTRHYPHTPGIDAAGVVVRSDSHDFDAGDEVIVIGHDLGVNTPGGFGQFIRVPARWAVRRPQGLTLRESMIYGTAGFTAAMCAEKLIGHGLTPQHGPLLVTGASGGVGSIAVALLAQLGYEVVAATGKEEAHSFLRKLGATEVIDRAEAQDESGRPLLGARWAGVVDVVGGEFLATALKSTRYGGAVAACGNTGSHELHTTVYPFILRSVTLYGVDSVNVDQRDRARLWQRLGDGWKLPQLQALASERSLEQLDAEIERILHGEQQGRVLLAHELPSDHVVDT